MKNEKYEITNHNELTRGSYNLKPFSIKPTIIREMTKNGGLVYPEFDENVNVIEPFSISRDWYDIISIVPGVNPLSAHWYAEDFDGNIYVIAEHYQAGETVEFHAQKIKEICNKLGWPSKNGMFEALIDSTSTQRTPASARTVADLFFENGILVNTKVNKDLFSGINKVKRYLKNAENKSKLFIFKNCTNMIKELKGYYWGNGDIPTKKDDHSLDELRYYLMTKNEKK